MDPTSFYAIYVDRRAGCDRIVRRSAPSQNGIGSEHDAVEENVQSLLLAFASVSVCVSAQSCLALLSDVDPNNPTLLIIDVPMEKDDFHDGRHDSGISTGLADVLGLPLLQHVCGEIESMRMPASIVPVALLTHDDGSIMSRTSVVVEESSDLDDPVVAKELKCIDNGAWDAFESPLSKESVRAMHLHCYRARKTVPKARKQSWVGIDESKTDNYSYLREKMVRDLMTEICWPKRLKVSSDGGRVGIPKSRALVVEKAVGRWEFSAHDFSDEELVHCAQTMFEHAFTMPEVADHVIKSDSLIDFIFACRATYNSQVPYHNFRHVVDVLQAIFFFMLQLGALPPYQHHERDDATEDAKEPSEPKTSLSHLIGPLDALTLLVVAIGHDVGHPGVSNAFLIVLKAPLAQLYNDKSVLESFHCAAFSQVLRKHWPRMMDHRKTIIEMILATDMALHFEYIEKLEKLRKQERDNKEWDDKTLADIQTLLCALLIKCADISNVARKLDCSAKWATILMEEFSRQAGMEKELEIPSSLGAPPVTGSVISLARSQVGFMKLFAVPLFEKLSHFLPEMRFSVRELVSNKSSWSEKIDQYVSQPPDEKRAIGGAPPNQQHQQQLKAASTTLLAPFVRPPSSSHGGSRRHLHEVLGTALMEAEIPPSDTEGSAAESGLSSPRPGVSVRQRTRSGNGNATAVTVVVTHPKQASARTNGYGPVSEKRPTYQHSTEHLRANEVSTTPNRPRSSPPDLGDCSDHSCSKGCCGNTAVVTNGTMERRSSRFFKKVRLWKTWRKEPSDG